MTPQFQGPIQVFPESGKSSAELLARARQLAWYHSLQLDESLSTEGIFALDEYVPYYLMPDSLAGLDCLEVGTGNGYWSFLMERRGARSVTATDIGAYIDTDFSRIHGPPSLCTVRTTNGEYGEPYRVAATLLGSRVDYKVRSVSGTRFSHVHFVPSPTCLVNMVRCGGYEQVLRGPTFLLRFRDRVRDPTPLCHTSLIALKDAARPVITLPACRRYGESERSARLEILGGPGRCTPARPSTSWSGS